MKRLTPFIFFIFLTVSIFGQLPYSESFETDLGIWTQSASDDMDWIRNSGPTPTASTGPAVASDGSFYMYIEATGNENPPKTAFLEANFDFSGTNNPILSFDYHMWGSGIGNLRVYAYNGSTWTEVWNQFNDQGNFWHNAKVNLRNYADSSNVTIRFIAETNYSELGDIAIDNIKIRDIYFVNISKTDLTCGGYSNGEIDITIAGGFPPYEYSYDDGDTYFPDASTNHVFTGLPGGDYLIKVKDISGFEIAGGTINLSEPETPDITTNKVNVGPCAYSHNGEIEIFATGSSAPFTYSINGFAGPFQISNNFTGLDTGTYEIAVKNTNGCIALGNNVYIAAPTEIFVLDVQQQNILTCNGDCNGELQIFAGGGNTPLDYSINDGVSYSGNTFFSGLCAGNYRFTIQDSKGCVQVTDYYTLTQPDALTFVDVSKTDVSGCFGDDNGIIDAEATGGTGTIQYSIDNGFLYQDSGYFENLSAGTYHLVIRDTKNCFKDWGLIEIFQPDLLLIDSVVVLNVQGCYGDADGEIHIYTQGGTGTVDYSIDNGTTLQGSPDFLPVDIGYYYPYVVDQNGCERTAPSVQITQPLPLLISDVVTYDVSDCYGSNTGKIQIFASLGTTPYQFSIDGGMTYQPDFTFNTLTAGEYYPSVLDAHGCEVFADTVYINQPSQIIINDQFSTDVSCFEGSDGSIFVSASGGTGDIHYSINEGVTFPFINSTISYQPEGTYIIAVRDDNGCITLGDTLIITQPDSLSIDSVTVLNVLGCYGDSTGVITLHVSGGSSPIDYSIDNGLHSQGTNVFNNLPAKTGYIPFVVDAGGCYALSNPITIGQPPQLVVTNQDHTDVDTCHGVPAGSIEITAAGGTGTISYSIDGGLTYVANGGVFTGLYAGDYDIFVSDANSCISEGWQENVYEPDTLLIDSLYFKDVVCNGQGNGQINIYASGGIPQIMYSINGGFTYSPSWQFTNLPPGNYNILVKDLYNCQVSDFVSLIQPPVFNIDTVIYTNVETCFGDNTATITIEASGGVPDILYTYTKIGVTPTTFQAGNVFNNVLAGSYFATAKDANGCVQSSSAFTVTQPNQVTLQNYHGTDISCHGLVNGMINVTATGGVGEYVYSIDNGNNWYDNGGLFTDLPAGSYNVTAADTNGCVANFPVVISIHEPPQLQIFSITTYNPTCNGYSDGQISIYSIGGTGEYTYVLNDTIIQSQALFDSLA
ncbi:MAG: hypothetical protein JXR36_12995, partial [Bacteroidales bacterium]|nr:hypothetical protein [Bacteroidales bacterium]